METRQRKMTLTAQIVEVSGESQSRKKKIAVVAEEDWIMRKMRTLENG